MPAQEWWVVKWKVGCEKILDGARLYAHCKFSSFEIHVNLSLIMLNYRKLLTVIRKEFGLGFMVLFSIEQQQKFVGINGLL